jgi:hypothetical protein
MEDFVFEEKDGMCFITFCGLPMGLLKVEGVDTPHWIWTSEMVFWQIGGLASTLEGIKKQFEYNFTSVPKVKEKILRNYRKSKWTVLYRG